MSSQGLDSHPACVLPLQTSQSTWVILLYDDGGASKWLLGDEGKGVLCLNSNKDLLRH